MSVLKFPGYIVEIRNDSSICGSALERMAEEMVGGLIRSQTLRTDIRRNKDVATVSITVRKDSTYPETTETKLRSRFRFERGRSGLLFGVFEENDVYRVLEEMPERLRDHYGMSMFQVSNLHFVEVNSEYRYSQIGSEKST